MYIYAKRQTTKPTQGNETMATKIQTKTFNVASNRPSAGSLLFSHTIAVLEIAGMFKNKARASRTVRTMREMIGQRAVSYHSKLGNFARDENGKVMLTDKGMAHFAGRVGRLGHDKRTDQTADGKVVKDMIAALKKGGTVKGVKFDTPVTVTW